MKLPNDLANLAGAVSPESASKAGRKDKTPESTETSGRKSADSVSTTKIARRLEVDPQRLERLREAVRNGTYSVSPREVAKRLVQDHLDDFNTRS